MEQPKKETYCQHYEARDQCDVGQQCECDERLRSNTHYECAYGPCAGEKCQRCGRFII